MFYGRFYDDLGAITQNVRKARLICSSIEAQDPDSRIKLTVDYPESKEVYTPFLNTEIKIDRDGNIDTRLYRKPQKKLLTLHATSHHPLAVKEHTIANMYQTAENVSSNDRNKEHSERMIDTLLLNNGYISRVLQQIRLKKERRPRKRRKNNEPHKDSVTTLKVPFLSDKCTAQVKRAAETLKIPVRVVTTPGKKLRDLLTSSRPLDQKKCPNDNCLTCSAMGNSGKCTDHNVVYEIKCGFQSCRSANIGLYNGETYRPVGERFMEHYRSARNPNAPSYLDKPLAKHYSSQHKDCENPKLEILKRAATITDRKIKEARVILKNKPDLNNRDEQTDLRKYLV